MMREAEQHAEEDRQRREDAEVRNQAESLVYQTEKFVKENDEKLPADVKESVNGALGEAQEALKGTDTAGDQGGDGEARHRVAEARCGAVPAAGRRRRRGWATRVPASSSRRCGRRGRRRDRGRGQEVTSDPSQRRQ